MPLQVELRFKAFSISTNTVTHFSRSLSTLFPRSLLINMPFKTTLLIRVCVCGGGRTHTNTHIHMYTYIHLLQFPSLPVLLMPARRNPPAAVYFPRALTTFSRRVWPDTESLFTFPVSLLPLTPSMFTARLFTPSAKW